MSTKLLAYHFYCCIVKKIDFQHVAKVRYDPDLHQNGKPNLDRPHNVANQKPKPLNKEGWIQLKYDSTDLNSAQQSQIQSDWDPETASQHPNQLLNLSIMQYGTGTLCNFGNIKHSAFGQGITGIHLDNY
jgi:hypothetical protein